MKYAFWVKNAEETIDSVVPSYRETSKIIASVPHTKENPNYVYRVGTFIPYFIKDSTKVLFNDSQLDVFKCIDWDWKNDKRTLERLVKLWFKFVVFDTNTHTIEKDPNWSLHKKVQRFVDWANKTIKVVYSKPEQWIAFMIIPTNEELAKMQRVIANTWASVGTWSSK